MELLTQEEKDYLRPLKQKGLNTNELLSKLKEFRSKKTVDTGKKQETVISKPSLYNTKLESAAESVVSGGKRFGEGDKVGGVLETAGGFARSISAPIETATESILVPYLEAVDKLGKKLGETELAQKLRDATPVIQNAIDEYFKSREKMVDIIQPQVSSAIGQFKKSEVFPAVKGISDIAQAGLEISGAAQLAKPFTSLAKTAIGKVSTGLAEKAYLKKTQKISDFLQPELSQSELESLAKKSGLTQEKSLLKGTQYKVAETPEYKEMVKTIQVRVPKLDLKNEYRSIQILNNKVSKLTNDLAGDLKNINLDLTDITNINKRLDSSIDNILKEVQEGSIVEHGIVGTQLVDSLKGNIMKKLSKNIDKGSIKIDMNTFLYDTRKELDNLMQLKYEKGIPQTDLQRYKFLLGVKIRAELNNILAEEAAKKGYKKVARVFKDSHNMYKAIDNLSTKVKPKKSKLIKIGTDVLKYGAGAGIAGTLLNQK